MLEFLIVCACLVIAAPLLRFLFNFAMGIVLIASWAAILLGMPSLLIYLLAHPDQWVSAHWDAIGIGLATLVAVAAVATGWFALWARDLI